jgi:UDP:flavonoid glycosyltransferase YjiC (YdhE family)
MANSFLFVLWAGGGNVPPQLALGRRLAGRGHAVRMLAPAVLRERIETAGVTYEPYRETPEHDESVPEQSLVRDFEQRSPLAAVAAARDNLLAAMARPVAADVLTILERHRVDVVAFDFSLFGALFAAEKAGVPAAMLVHTVYPFPAPGLPPYGTGWMPMSGPAGRVRDAIGALAFHWIYERPLLPRFNAVRATLGLPHAASLADLLQRTTRIFVLTTPAFDFPGCLPSHAEYIGPQLEVAEWTPRWEVPWPPGDGRPLVVVGLTTTYQAHGALLNRIASALGTLPVRALVSTGHLRVDAAPPNVYVASYVPHVRILPHAAAVVTHAGLGTVHAALVHGVPMVCLPIGRDQPDNAARVVYRGVGVRLPPTSNVAAIAAAIDRVVHDDALRGSARRLAQAIRDGQPPEAGAVALERLAAAQTASARGRVESTELTPASWHR